MKILVEEYPYQSEQAKKILAWFEPRQSQKGLSSDYVGYCFSKELNDCIFFLPKVILNTHDKIFENYSPEQILDIDHSGLNGEQKQFLGTLSIWIYRALKEYAANERDSKILKEKSFSTITTGEQVNGTYLDVILSLIKFYNENKDFFIFTLKNIHSQQHKINWRRTISKTQAIVQDDVPIYLNPVSKKKEINWDEELLVIFFSILNHLKKYGFNISIDYNYELINGELFQSYLDGLGLKLLRKIKYKYFSDKTRQLWNLCYTFFLKSEEISSSKNDSDFLMATSFHIVFEDMVDELLGDPYYENWKQIGDGKVVDHIYKYQSLFSDDDTFYIGDSKYYQTKRTVEERSESAVKQFTYARSIVNNSIKQSIGNTWPFRDSLTEGYTVTPNFFISAETDPELRYDIDGLNRDEMHSKPFVSRQFVNRLFDRDTLWVRQYNLNFLYLISVYSSDNQSLKESFRRKARVFFRNQTIDLLNDHYYFWVLTPKSSQPIEDVLGDSSKWKLRGVAYRLGRDSNQLIMAIQKPCEDSQEINELDDNMRIETDIDCLKEFVPTFFDSVPCVLSKKEGEFVQYENIDIPEKYLKLFN